MIRGGFLVGGEESGGLTIAGHVPEKDGVLACLLMAELVAREKKSLGAILRKIYNQAGVILSDRVNVHLDSNEMGAHIKSRLEQFHPVRLAGRKVASLDQMDGFKYILDNGDWLAIRLSGTEPVARLYLEAQTPQALKRLATEGKKLLAGA
jgi:phosphomannomutase